MKKNTYQKKEKKKQQKCEVIFCSAVVRPEDTPSKSTEFELSDY